jgi:hypothetical protein
VYKILLVFAKLGSCHRFLRKTQKFSLKMAENCDYVHHRPSCRGEEIFCNVLTRIYVSTYIFLKTKDHYYIMSCQGGKKKNWFLTVASKRSKVLRKITFETKTCEGKNKKISTFLFKKAALQLLIPLVIFDIYMWRYITWPTLPTSTTYILHTYIHYIPTSTLPTLPTYVTSTYIHIAHYLCTYTWTLVCAGKVNISCSGQFGWASKIACRHLSWVKSDYRKSKRKER